MNVIWKECFSLPEFEISTLGQIRFKSTQQPLKTYIHVKGYEVFNRQKAKVRKSYKVHRLVAQTFLDNPENKPCVNHINAVKNDNWVENLEWCTHYENMRHAFDNNLVPPLKGELNGRAVLNEQLVHLICQDYVNGVRPCVVMEKYQITKNQAIKIKVKSSWKHITSQYKY